MGIVILPKRKVFFKSTLMHRYLLYVILGFSSLVYGQSIESRWNVDVMSGIHDDSNPFWLTHNTEFRYGEMSNFSGLAGWSGRFQLTESASLNAVVSGYYRDGVTDELQRKELFLNFTNRWLKATLGSQSRMDPTSGLSSTAQNFLMSGNARPIPGILLESNAPLALWDQVYIDWGIGHYFLNDDRYVENTNLHFKKLAVAWQWNPRNRVKIRIQHYAQWGGESPEYGELTDDFGAFFDVFFASQPESDPVPGEAINALGNHLGSYMLEYQYQSEWGNLVFYHEHPFEDGSGSGLANFPDGVWGVFFTPSSSRFFKGMLYEYTDTSNQSIETASGADNYFSNSIYRSGWAYEGNIIGIPFMLYNTELEIEPETTPIVSNRFIAHHASAQGEFQRFYWMLRTSIVRHLRSYKNQGQGEMSFWYNSATLGYRFEDYGQIRLTFGLDTSDVMDNRYGGVIGYSIGF